MARKLSTKQSATAAVSSPSGDHWLPGPSNSLGGARFDDAHALGGQRHIAVGPNGRIDGVVMGKWVHEELRCQ